MNKLNKLLLIWMVVMGLMLVAVSRPLAAPPAPNSNPPAAPETIIWLEEPWQEAQVPGFRLVLGNNYTLEEGETLNMNLGVLGGNALLKTGSVVEGDVILLGGNLRAEGTIQGDVIILGGSADLESTAVVEGSVDVIGGNLDRSPGATIVGSVNEGPMGLVINPLDLRLFPSDFRFDPLTGFNVPTFRNPVLELLWLFARSFMWAVVAVLAALFLAVPIDRVGQAAIRQPLASGGVGCLTAIVVPVLLVLLAITLICIPVSLLGAFVLVIAWAFGMISLGTEVGKKISQLFRHEWALPLSAGIGTFLLTLVINGIGQFVPCLGWAVPLLVGILGIGAVLITRFGSRTYPAYASAVDFTTPAAGQASMSAPDAFQDDLPLPPASEPEQPKPEQ
jgi:hypothetical protein